MSEVGRRFQYDLEGALRVGVYNDGATRSGEHVFKRVHDRHALCLETVGIRASSLFDGVMPHAEVIYHACCAGSQSAHVNHFDL